ncbi:hypothetical protein [Leeuwenhoekiella marinoflava]|uniref:Uncharacterized protein n=2 Tax=Leeuwenhoekiella marinoflava TaxID=988 RepID=A0A4Q0PMT9_9FLAO|nr:hypothetical protein [Leeuwenhoekiella marinoflava]RXG31856.1 hypothetical protein DSL99_1680 [Leeuwenhoekiella marinoflava]SHF02532.1 hypothetical protein SAMN02745246_01502 [Leeuwenhoekiella marinoflava DSM 3653]
MNWEEYDLYEELPFHDEFREEVLDKLLKLHRQLILIENLDGVSRMPFLRNVVELRHFFWDIGEYLHENEDLFYIHAKLEKLMEEIKISVPLSKRTRTH